MVQVNPEELKIIKAIETIIGTSLSNENILKPLKNCYTANTNGSVTGISIYGHEAVPLIEIVQLMEHLTNITELFLSSNQIQNIEPIKQLTNITKLYLNDNQIQNIEPIKQLTNISTLLLHNNQIQNIEPIKQLTNISTLYLSSNQIQNIEPIKQLTNISTLFLHNNQIQNIEPIKQLTNITRLDLDDNQIQNIEPIKQLTNITSLYLHNNQIGGLTLPENENHIKLVREYLARQEKQGSASGRVPLHITQLLVLGNGETGKTSVLRRLRDTCIEIEALGEDDIEQLPDADDSTHGNIHYYWKLNNKENDKRYLLVKDFGGQEYYHHFHPAFYHPQALYWIVTTPAEAIEGDTRAENGTFTPAYWHENIRHSLRYFHKEKKENDIINAWLLMNKGDMQKGNIDTGMLPTFQRFYNLYSKNGWEDIKTEAGQKKYMAAQTQLYHELIEFIERLESEIEINDFSKSIFEKLNSRSEKDKLKRISFTIPELKKFLKQIAKKSTKDIEDYIHSTINDLRLLGLCIILKKDENPDNNIIYLYPQQLTQTIFNTIITDEVRENMDGIILESSFSDNEHLKELLVDYEVIFQDGDTEEWIAPQFLPTTFNDKELLNIAKDGLKEKITLHFNDYMPKGIMSRLIGYFGENPNKKWYWRNGILFTHTLGGRKSKAMITADWNEFTVSIEAETKKDLNTIYRKVLLSYFNIPIDEEDDNEVIDDDRKTKKDSERVILTDTLRVRKVYSLDFIDISISLNGRNRVPLIEFKKRFDAETPKPTFELLLPKQDDSDIPETVLIKVHDYLPFIKHMINTEKFETMYQPKKLFISYSHDDMDTCAKIKNHIRILERQGYISTWTDALIEPGSKWDEKIENALQEADIVMLLMSESFFASEYIWNRELEIINNKLAAGNATILPILCRHCLWNVHTPFEKDIEKDEDENIRENIGKLQAMPIKDGRLNPIHSEAYRYPDEAYTDIADKLKKLLTPKN